MADIAGVLATGGTALYSAAAGAGFRRWQVDGTWRRLLAHAQTKSDAIGEVDWEVVVDATIVRAHQHAAGARKRGTAAT